MPKNGNIATAKITIPMPPKPLSIERQSKTERGKDSTSGMTVAPVAVTPETLSNKADVISGVADDKINGRAENNATVTQQTNVIK